jgi:hypothetical protein
MTRTTGSIALLATLLLVPPLAAQDTTAATAAAQNPAAMPGSGVVKPGMTEAQVIAAWGQPLAVRRMNDWTFLFYGNGDERHWGYDDTVFLQNGQVMDAIVRSPDHVYDGQSSSPEGRVPAYTPPEGTSPDTGPGAVTGVRVKPSR